MRLSIIFVVLASLLSISVGLGFQSLRFDYFSPFTPFLSSNNKIVFSLIDQNSDADLQQPIPTSKITLLSNFVPTLADYDCFGIPSTSFSLNSQKSSTPEFDQLYGQRYFTTLTSTDPLNTLQLYPFFQCNFTMLDTKNATLYGNITIPLFYTLALDDHEIPINNLCRHDGTDCTDDHNFAVSGYYASWSVRGRSDPYTNTQYRTLNQIYYSFIVPDSETGDLLFDDYSASAHVLRGMAKAKITYPHLRSMLSIGGWSYQSIPVSKRIAAVASSAEKTDYFLKIVVGMLRLLQFDGVDLDWEWDADYDLKKAPGELVLNFTRSVKNALKKAGKIDKKKYYFSAAVASNFNTINALQRPDNPNRIEKFWFKMGELVDQFNIMSYGYRGGCKKGDYSYLQSPYTQPALESKVTNTKASIKLTLDLYRKLGISKRKLMIGSALQVRTFKVTSDTYGGLYQIIEGPGFGDRAEGIIDYKCLVNPVNDPMTGCTKKDFNVQNLNNLEYYDSKRNIKAFEKFGKRALQSWAYSPSASVMMTYDDPWAITEKCKVIKSQGYRGIFFWAIDGDTPEYSQNSLITAANRALLKVSA